MSDPEAGEHESGVPWWETEAGQAQMAAHARETGLAAIAEGRHLVPGQRDDLARLQSRRDEIVARLGSPPELAEAPGEHADDAKEGTAEPAPRGPTLDDPPLGTLREVEIEEPQNEDEEIEP